MYMPIKLIVDKIVLSDYTKVSNWLLPKDRIIEITDIAYKKEIEVNNYWYHKQV